MQTERRGGGGEVYSRAHSFLDAILYLRDQDLDNLMIDKQLVNGTKAMTFSVLFVFYCRFVFLIITYIY